MPIAPKKIHSEASEEKAVRKGEAARGEDKARAFIGLGRGRPRKSPDDQRTHLVKVMFDARSMADIEAICATSGETPTAMVHRAVHEWLAMRRAEQLAALRFEMRGHLKEVAREIAPELIAKLVEAAPRETQTALLEALRKLERM